MRDKDLYARILKIEAPWRVADVELNLEQGEVVVHVEHDGEALNCPQCGQPARRYDTRRAALAAPGYLPVPHDSGCRDAAGAV